MCLCFGNLSWDETNHEPFSALYTPMQARVLLYPVYKTSYSIMHLNKLFKTRAKYCRILPSTIN